jgi:hypothetical protein
MVPIGGARAGVLGAAGGDAIPDSAIHYFENNSITVSNSDWSGWAGDTGALTVQDQTVLAGDFSGQISGNADNGVSATRDASYEPSEVSLLLQADQVGSNSNDGMQVALFNGSTLIHLLRFDYSGTVRSFTTSVGTASWSADTTYKVRYFNFDFQNDTCDLEVIRVSDSTVILSSTGTTFDNSVSGLDEIEVRNNDNDSGGIGVTVFFDNVDGPT